MLKFLRQTPPAFWIALLGIAFLLWIFVTRFWDFQSGFALILIPGFLLVAVMSAVHHPGAWLSAAVIAGFLTLLEGGLAVLFWIGSLNESGLLGAILSHGVLAAIAISCSASALVAALRSDLGGRGHPAT